MPQKKATAKKATKKRNNKAVNKVASKVVEHKEETKRGSYVDTKNAKTLDLFTEFMALPSVVRSDIFRHPKTDEPLETQKDFAEAYGVDQSRLSEYKRTEEYEQKVSKKRRSYFKGEIGDAIYAVMLNVVKEGRGSDLKVLLEYAKEVERDDPLGETSETLNAILKKLNNMIPG